MKRTPFEKRRFARDKQAMRLGKVNECADMIFILLRENKRLQECCRRNRKKHKGYFKKFILPQLKAWARKHDAASQKIIELETMLAVRPDSLQGSLIVGIELDGSESRTPGVVVTTNMPRRRRSA